MQRISVDLPEPGRAANDDFLALLDGEIDVPRTWNSPNHLCRPIIWIAAGELVC